MKYRYRVNKRNLLVVNSPKLKTPLVANGSFAIDKDNRLTYWLNEPAYWRRIY